MITLSHVYLLAGVFFALIAVLSFMEGSGPRRAGSALFWGLMSTSFLFGKGIGDLANGLLAVALILVGALGMNRSSASPEKTSSARDDQRRGSLLFLPALIIPATALAGTLLVRHTTWASSLIDPPQATLISLALGALISVTVLMIWLRPPLLTPVREARRLLDTVGWAAILPQMLAALGAVFLAAGVGDDVGRLASAWLPLDTRSSAITAYCIGMALFTMMMGNAFAAFPVMTAAIGLPILIREFGGDPAAVCAIGMLAGFCGTLMTPMAANFNVVPANLLDLPDRRNAFNGVIRAQTPTALCLLLVNIVLMNLLAFPS
jgi:uncharacterized membrane protein